MAGDASVFDGASPIAGWFELLLVQIMIIVIFTRLLGVGLRYVHQPRVMAEVIGGILLGPSVLGRIPGYMDTIFPASSMAVLSALANLGLVMFLFIVGLELEVALLKENAVNSIAISSVGILVPFAAGVGVAAVLWNTSAEGITVSFGAFAAFCAVAMSITAFPVLARIIAERKLMTTPVGVSALTAAAVGDVVAWCFLALVVAITRSTGSAVTVVYVFLCTAAFSALMLLGVRPILERGIKTRRFGKSAVSQTTVVAAFMLALFSAWVTQFLGVHAIFGAFIAGLAMPRHEGFAVSLIEKIEDFVSIILLPLYFAYSGLRTQIGALSTGADWGLCLFVIFMAVVSKIGSTTTAARFLKMPWRESFAVGIMMNTKGLVELIVLNIGLDAGALNQTIFVMMVLMALVTTFMTTPLLAAVYSTKHHQERMLKDIRKSLDLTKPKTLADLEVIYKYRLHSVVWLQTRQDLGDLIALYGLFGDVTFPDTDSNENFQRPRALATQQEEAEDFGEIPPLSVCAIRLLHLSERNSSVLKATVMSQTGPQDGLLDAFRSSIAQYGIVPSVYATVTTNEEIVGDITNVAQVQRAGVVILPWQEPDEYHPHIPNHHQRDFFGNGPSRHDAIMDLLDVCETQVALLAVRPRPEVPRANSISHQLQAMFERDGDVETPKAEMSSSVGVNNLEMAPVGTANIHTQYGRGGFLSIDSQAQVRVVVPFFGGNDDRSAGLLALRLARKSRRIMVHFIIVRTPGQTQAAEGTIGEGKGEAGKGETNETATNAESMNGVGKAADGKEEVSRAPGAGADGEGALDVEGDVSDDDEAMVAFVRSLAVAPHSQVVISVVHGATPTDGIMEQLRRHHANVDAAKEQADQQTTAPGAHPHLQYPVALVVCGRRSPIDMPRWQGLSDVRLSDPTKSIPSGTTPNASNAIRAAVDALGPVGAVIYRKNGTPIPVLAVRSEIPTPAKE
eukprot:comp44856_c0_seq1/m.47519 comp44856_c0_seq1/g.47519  ORF comp44856_c0_seq1/g.47519 comp44856_c0_seq1/m.47519 type:complete len:962 (-) comp44856_c0_seq1:196-3081(-)